MTKVSGCVCFGSGLNGMFAWRDQQFIIYMICADHGWAQNLNRKYTLNLIFRGLFLQDFYAVFPETKPLLYRKTHWRGNLKTNLKLAFSGQLMRILNFRLNPPKFLIALKKEKIPIEFLVKTSFDLRHLLLKGRTPKKRYTDLILDSLSSSRVLYSFKSTL